ncbi:IS3 family transposase [Arthrobacter sp. Hz1]
MQVAPRTYRSWKSKAPAARTVSDAAVINALKGTAEKSESLYGRRKMTAWLRREGHVVARCTVDRLMRDEAMNGSFAAGNLKPALQRRIPGGPRTC